MLSFSSSFLVFIDSSLASNTASLLVVSAVFKASSIISLDFYSALPIFASYDFLRWATAKNQAAGKTIHKVATTLIAIIVGVFTGAPPYLVFIVQSQHINFILFLELCQVKFTFSYAF